MKNQALHSVSCTNLKPSDRKALVAARDGTRSISAKDFWSLESQGLVKSSSKGWELTEVGREIAALQ